MDCLNCLFFEPDWTCICRRTTNNLAILGFRDNHNLTYTTLHEHLVGVFFVDNLYSDQSRFWAALHQFLVGCAVTRLHWTQTILNMVGDRGGFCLHDAHRYHLFCELTEREGT